MWVVENWQLVNCGILLQNQTVTQNLTLTLRLVLGVVCHSITAALSYKLSHCGQSGTKNESYMLWGWLHSRHTVRMHFNQFIDFVMPSTNVHCLYTHLLFQQIQLTAVNKKVETGALHLCNCILYIFTEHMQKSIVMVRVGGWQVALQLPPRWLNNLYVSTSFWNQIWIWRREVN